MTPLDHLITSRVLSKVIKHFCNAYKPIGARQLARQIGEDAGNTNRTIKRLINAGLVEKIGSGRNTSYQAVDGYSMECLRELTR